MTTKRDVLDAALRQDLSAFIEKSFQTVAPGETYAPNWHIECIAWHLRQCVDGDIRRLIITLPPRHLKSICASVAFPAWVLGKDPTRKIICVSYSQDLAAKHARDTRAVMESSWYRRLFHDTRFDRRKNTETEMVTTRKGFRYATSVGGTLTGRGGNLLIIDDPIKPDEVMSEAERNRVKYFYDGVLYSRLNDKNEDGIVLIMQRLHLNDLVGHVLEKEDWVHLDIPAIAEEERTYEIGKERVYVRPAGEVLHEARESRETLDVIKRQLGTYLFEAQYQQRPFPPAGNLIKREWLQTYKAPLPRTEYDQVVQSWDTASTVSDSSDYSVNITFGVKNNTAHILDVVRVRLEYPDLRRRVLREAERFKADVVLIERTSSGLQLAPDLRREGLLRPITRRPRGDKISRMEAQTAAIEAGYVLLPERALWLEDLKAELLSFPNARHDDQVDALSQFLEWHSHQRWRNRVRVNREEGRRRMGKRRQGLPRGRRRSIWSGGVWDNLTSNERLFDTYYSKRPL